MYNRELGSKIRQLRKDRGLNLREAGEKIGIDYSHLGKIERGEMIPKMNTIEKIANFFAVDVSYLVGEEKELPEYMVPLVKKWYSFIKEADTKYSPSELKEILEFVEKVRQNDNK